MLMAVLAACTDDLNQRPQTEVDADAVYANPENYQLVLAKLYASFVIAGQEEGGGNADLASNNGHDFLRGYFNLQEGPTDEMAATWLSGDKMEGLSYMTWDANDPWVADTYYRAYYTIALCNEFLRHAGDDAISGFGADKQAEIRQYRAEARFLRALSYYFVLDLFGKGPFVDETMPVGAFTPEAYTNAQLFAYIESELKDIEDQLADRTAVVYGHATQGAAWALLARLYLNAEVYGAGNHYTDCVTYCKKVIASGYTIAKDAVTYTAADGNEVVVPAYATLFNADNDKRTGELIFNFVVDGTNTVSWGATTYIVCGECGNSSAQNAADYGLTSGWGMFRVRGEIPALFGDVTTSADSRAMFFTTEQNQWLDKSIDDQTYGYFGEKFSNLRDNGEPASDTAADGASIDFPVFRLADVYLMAAEAVLRGGSGYTKDEVLAFVNELRERAYGDQSGNITSPELTLSFILDERGREMWWECTRRTDLIRYGLFTGGTYVWQWKGGVVDGRATNSRYNVYPIPTAELSANPNLKNENY